METILSSDDSSDRELKSLKNQLKGKFFFKYILNIDVTVPIYFL